MTHGAALARQYERLEHALDGMFGTRANPLRHLGAAAFLLFWLLVASGTLLYVVYDSSVAGALRSVEEFAATPVGRLARGLHRYGADAFVVLNLGHLVREWILGRFRGARAFAWVSGVILLALVYAAGIGGYWLPADRIAQWSLLATAEWFDALPLAAGDMVRNFIAGDGLNDRFLSLAVFLHLGIPLLLLLGMWVHIQRITRPEVTPHRALAVPLIAMLALLALALPVRSLLPVREAELAGALSVDWIILFVHPIADKLTPAGAWALVGGVFALLIALPWISAKAREPAAIVSPANCNGCGRCVADCPFAAVSMEPRTDGRRGAAIARVRPELCTACGLCAGACPSSTPFRQGEALVTGIDLPGRPLAALRASLDDALASRNRRGAASGDADAVVVVFACERALASETLGAIGPSAIPLVCAGQLPPSFVDYALRAGADGVALVHCVGDGCFFRLGDMFTRERFAAQREPHLRASVPLARVRLIPALAVDPLGLLSALSSFRRELAGGTIDRGAEGAVMRPPKRHDPELRNGIAG